MRSIHLFAWVGLLGSAMVQAQDALVVATGKSNEFQLVSTSLHAAALGADFQEWQRIHTLRDSNGNTLSVTNSAYLEMQTGMHYPEGGEWKESRELIEGHPGGAIARYGGHKAIFAESFSMPVVVDLETPDGRRLQSRVLGLRYSDTASGKSVWVAEAASSTGKIITSNQVLYPEAFKGVQADVRYTYTKAGLEQDVILREQLPTPESFGLDAKTTRLQVITEFLAPPDPVIETKTLGADADRFEDQTIDFGAMQMVAGKAFMIGAGETDSLETPVSKRWSVVDGRTILTEEVALSRVAKQLESLPAKKRTAFLWKKSRKAAATVNLNLPTRPAGKPANRAMQLAKLQSPDRGLVLDYVLVSSQANFTFKGDTTYYVSGVVNLSGTTTIEGGVVIKYNTGGTAISVSGSGLVCQAGPYRPVILTSKHDDSVGEIISGSTGAPTKPTSTLPIYLQVLVGNNPFKYLHFRYAGIALSQSYRPVWHCQFVNCNIAISGDSQSPYGQTMELHNALFANCTTAVRNQPAYWTSSCLSVAGEHVTADQIGTFLQTGCTAGYSVLTNSILTAVNSLGNTMNLDHCINQASSSGIFEFPNGGAGNYYLTDSTRTTPTAPDINPTLRADLRKKTTHQPLEATGPISSPTTWSQTNIRDTSANPEIGYHYDPLDYVAGEVTLNAPLTLADGVVVGVRGPYGFTGGTLTSVGSPSKHNTIAMYSAVQEQPLAWGANPASTYLLNSWNSDTRFRFTDILLANSGGFCLSSSPGSLEIKDCWLHGNKLTVSDGYAITLGVTNNILERCDVSLLSCSSGAYYAHFYNNLFLNGNLGLAGACDGSILPNFAVKNNLFVKGGFTYGTSSGLSPVIANNGYYQTTVTSQGTNPKVLTATPDFQPGPLGSYYYPTTGGNLSQLIDVGVGTSASLGLEIYTTQANLAPDSGTVDIGFHYPDFSTVATEFWIAFCNAPTDNIFGDALEMAVYVTSPVATFGALSIPGLGSGFEQVFSVVPGVATKVVVPIDAMITTYDAIQNKGVRVTAAKPVSVIGFYYLPTASTAFTAYPTPTLGNNYRVMGYSGAGGPVPDTSQFAIVATEDNTTVTITPSSTADLAGHPGTAPFTLTPPLMKGQTYQIKSRYITSLEDVTGTVVVSDKPIGVFSGALAANVPIDRIAANPIMQEQIPVSAWGLQALSLPFSSRTGGDTYRVLAANNDTEVTINGSVAATLDAGEVYEDIIDGPVVFQGSKAIQVAHFANGGNFDHPSPPFEGDPCEILLPPIASWVQSYIVTTPSEPNPISPNFASYLNIIVPVSATGSTYVDGQIVPPTSFQAIGSSGYSGTQYPITVGTHKVTCSAPCGVQVYGFGEWDAYGLFGGVIGWLNP